jgi:hypothetical protein
VGGSTQEDFLDLFLKTQEIFWYYFVEYISYTFDLHTFSFFDAHDLQVWPFAGVAKFLHILFAVL